MRNTSERLTMPDLVAADRVDASACVVSAMTITVFKPEALLERSSVGRAMVCVLSEGSSPSVPMILVAISISFSFLKAPVVR